MWEQLICRSSGDSLDLDLVSEMDEEQRGGLSS